MSERTYKMVETPPGQKGTSIHEFVGDERGPCVLWLPEGTAPETKHDVVMALQRVHRNARADRVRADIDE